MADRIQQRRDTAARWEEINPILLEGEIGIVLDDPNQYKVGDGESAWNDLPLRGFDGTIVHEPGDSETAVMSQKGVTEKFAELASDISVVSQNSIINNRIKELYIDKNNLRFASANRN